MREIGEQEYIMSKNQINFTKISNEATMQLNTFKDSALAIATEDLRYKRKITRKEQSERVDYKRP